MPFTDPEQRRAYNREWMRKRREDWLREHGPCSECSSWDDLEVHHEDPSQKVTHRVWSWSQARRDAELAKCKVLCASCHQKETTQHRRENIVHGTPNGYRQHRCPCEPCRKAKNKDRDDWRRRRREAGLPYT